MTDVELVKSKIDIVDFLSEYVQLKRAGRNFKALCPFHSEKTPSFIISPERQSWHCFGACGEGGDVISFLQKWENLEFVEALKILAQRGGVTLSSYKPSEGTELKAKLYKINSLACEFFHFLLTSHKSGNRAREYLKSRGIKDEIIKTFTLGYAPDSWDSLLKFLQKKGYSNTDINTAGLLVRSDRGTYYDRFRGRLMFTLRDHRGNIVGFSGRLLDEGVYSEHQRGAKYVNTSETPIYIKGNTLYGLDVTKEAVKREKEAVVVEGEFDLLSSFQAGITNVVAIKGSAFTEGQTVLLRRFTENICLALDSDFAGSEAARRGIEIAEKAGLVVNVIELPFGKDPAECIEKDPHLWKRAVKATIPIYDFIIKTAFAKYENDGVVGKKKIGNDVIPFLSKIENPIILSHYTKELAKKLQVGEESIELSIRNFQKKKEDLQVFKTVTSSNISRDVLLEEYFLSLIVQSDDPHKSLALALKILTPDDFYQPPVKKVLELLAGFLHSHKKFEIKKFSSLLTSEVVPTFDKAYLIDRSNILSDGKRFDKELVHTCCEIKKMSLRRRINSISTKIRQAEEKETNPDNKKLNEQLRELLTQVREVDKTAQEA